MTDLSPSAIFPPLRLLAGPEHEGLRLDQFLARALPEHSRARLQHWIAAGSVTTAAGGAVRAAGRVHAGDAFLVQPERLPSIGPFSGLAPVDLPLEIVYQDADLAVVNKPSGLLVHPGAGRQEPTLVHALLHHFGPGQALLPGAEAQRPGIVHRLDRLASGLMVVALSEAAHRQLSAAFARREVEKTYCALVHGCLSPEHGVIEQPIARDRIRRTRMTTRNPRGRAARSEYRVLHSWSLPALPGGGFSLLEVRILSGRTHQIRVHLSSLGHPIAGDRAYGAPAVLVPAPAAAARGVVALPEALAVWRGRKLERLFLHAARLAFTHPVRGGWMEFSAPLPPELELFLAPLRQLPEKLKNDPAANA